MGIDPSTMVSLIDELEGEGLAKRRPHPEDRRARQVSITPKGRRRLVRAQGSWRPRRRTRCSAVSAPPSAVTCSGSSAEAFHVRSPQPMWSAAEESWRRLVRLLSRHLSSAWDVNERRVCHRTSRPLRPPPCRRWRARDRRCCRRTRPKLFRDRLRWARGGAGAVELDCSSWPPISPPPPSANRPADSSPAAALCPFGDVAARGVSGIGDARSGRGVGTLTAGLPSSAATRA